MKDFSIDRFVTTFSNSPCFSNYCLRQSYPEMYPFENNPKTGNPNTQHSLNPVPCIVIDKNKKWKITNKKGGLSNISPTLLTLMGIKKPKEMTSETLIKEN